MEISLIVTLIIAGLFGVVGLTCVGKGLYLHYCERPGTISEEFKERLDILNQQWEEVSKKIEELEGKRKQFGEDREIGDVEWCIDDNRWRLQDIEWEIRDTRWEANDRRHQRRTSTAAFWAVLGAASLALASLVISLGSTLIMR